MRILLVVHQYPPSHLGGTELHTQGAATALAHRGHEVHVFFRSSDPGRGVERRESEGAVTWQAWAGPMSPRRRFLATFRDPPIHQAFERALDDGRPDLIHIHHGMGLPVSLLRSIQEHGIPYVVTLHDYWWVCANAQLLTNYSHELCTGPRAYLNCARCLLARAGHTGIWPAAPLLAPSLLWRRRLLGRVLVHAARLIAPSRFVKEWYGNHGLPPDSVTVLPHGIEWPDWLTGRQGPAEPLRVAYLGGLTEQKGVHVLVEAFAGLNGNAELWVAGDESTDSAYLRRLRSIASPSVHFLGRLSRQQVWDVLSQAHLVAVPSLWPETFSLALHEAFAAGVPVVASQIGALMEAVVDGQDGLLLPAGDVSAWRQALRRLLDDPTLLPRLQANVTPPTRVTQYAAELEALYIACMAGGSGTPAPISILSAQ